MGVESGGPARGPPGREDGVRGEVSWAVRLEAATPGGEAEASRVVRLEAATPGGEAEASRVVRLGGES